MPLLIETMFLLLIAFAIGLLVGYLIWGKRRHAA